MNCVFDIETDGLNPTKIHVVSYMTTDMDEPVSIFDYDQMRVFFSRAYTFVGHNIWRYDLPAIKKILGSTVPDSEVYDTLPISWYINHDRTRSHGLAAYGEDFGVPKPKIDDWENLTPEEYAHRCEEDVKINMKLYKELEAKLDALYGSPEEVKKIVAYLNFKMKCAADQEQLGWSFDKDKAQQHHDTLVQLQAEKMEELSKAMPKNPIFAKRTRPKVMYKKDGTLSSHGQRWVELTKKLGLPESTESANELINMEDGNPNSTDQVKYWLESLGWEPQTFKFVKNKTTGEEKSIPQVRRDGELCPSVLELVDRDPAVELLDGLTVIQHRLGIFKAFLECEEGGVLRASVSGFTNTLRFRHARPLVNLPGVDKPWGKEIRECLVSGDGYKMYGADMVSLEDTTKRHYMQPLDPKYVEEMQKPGFDPHLDLAKFAGAVTQEEIDDYNAGNRPDLKALRKSYKVVNYSATYGVGAAKLSRETGMTHSQCQKLLDAFWQRNWSVRETANRCRIRTVLGSTWLQNPVSGFWHSLRSEKDAFSTLNQSTGVYCFDSWVYICKKVHGVPIVGQFHDEIIALEPDNEEGMGDKLKQAIQTVNGKIKLNVPLDIDYSVGKNYAEVH